MITKKVGLQGAAVGLAIVAGMSLTACSSSSSTTSSASPSSTAVTADAALAAKVPADIKSTGKLTYGTDASYAPSEFLAEDGSTIQGFDIDLANAVAARLGLTGDPQNATFGTIITGVTQGKYNAGVSSFTINAERLKEVNMVSYFNAGTAWATKTGNPSGITPDNACGKTVAVQTGTVQVDDVEARSKACTSASKPAITVQQYTLQSDATSAVVSTKVDAMLADSPVIAYAIKQSGQMEQVGEIYEAAPYGIAIQKAQTEFAALVTEAVNSLIKDGTYNRILTTWGVQSGAITESRLNPTA